MEIWFTGMWLSGEVVFGMCVQLDGVYGKPLSQ